MATSTLRSRLDHALGVIEMGDTRAAAVDGDITTTAMQNLDAREAADLYRTLADFRREMDQIVDHAFDTNDECRFCGGYFEDGHSSMCVIAAFQREGK